MGTREELDDMLRDFLEEQRRDPLQRLVRTIADRQIEHEKQDDHRHAEVMGVLRGHDYRISTLERAQVPALPPMRAEMPSSNDLAKAVGHDVAQRFEAEARNPSTPPPNATDVAAMVEDRVQVELIKIKAAALQKAEDQRQADEQEKKALAALNAKSRSRAFWTAIGALITTGSAIAYALVEHFSR